MTGFSFLKGFGSGCALAMVVGPWKRRMGTWGCLDTQNWLAASFKFLWTSPTSRGILSGIWLLKHISTYYLFSPEKNVHDSGKHIKYLLMINHKQGYLGGSEVVWCVGHLPYTWPTWSVFHIVLGAPSEVILEHHQVWPPTNKKKFVWGQKCKIIHRFHI